MKQLISFLLILSFCAYGVFSQEPVTPCKDNSSNANLPEKQRNQAYLLLTAVRAGNLE
jgi:hypothetical protein